MTDILFGISHHFEGTSDLSLPDTITVFDAGLTRVYSGDIATSRRTNTSAGVTRTIDIIQSVPNKAGRWRHVVRYTQSAPTAVAGVFDTLTFTVTMDSAANADPNGVAVTLRGVLAALNDSWDEVAAGQQ